MSMREKALQLKQDFDEVYEAGKNTIYDIVLDGGKRTNCEYTFSYWNCEYIRPPFVWKPTTRNIHCFSQCKNLKKIEKQYFDFSGCPANGKGTQGHYYTCFYCPDLEVFEDIGLPAGDYEGTWQNCRKLHTIEIVRSSRATKYTSMTWNCQELVNIRFEGEIGQNISFGSNGKLSVESVVDILQHLYDYSETSDAGTRTITLHDDVKALMWEQGIMEELDDVTYTDYITGKGWNLA